MKFLLAALASLITASASAQPVHIGDLGTMADAPFYIAYDKGYFKAEKLDVRLERFNSAAQATSPLANNRVQVTTTSVGAQMFNAFAEDWGVRAVLAGTRLESEALLVRSDLGIKSVADLKGRKIAVNTPASPLHFLLGRLLESDGLALTSVETPFMPWPNMRPALETRAIDGGMVNEPFAAQYSASGVATVFKRASDIVKSLPVDASVVLFNIGWADKQPDQARSFAVAYLKGVRDYDAAMKGGPQRGEVVEILARYTGLKDKTLYDRIQWSRIDPNGEISREGLQVQQEWYGRQGVLPKRADLQKMVDRSFLDHALGVLGRVN